MIFRHRTRLFFGSIAIVLLPVAIFVTDRNIYRGYASRSWPQTEAKINYLNNDDTFRVRRDGVHVYRGNQLVRYSYEVDEHRYEGNRVDFEDFDLNESVILPAGLASLSSRYPLGTKTTVFYNPDDPSDSVLVPGQTWWKACFKVGMLSAFVGALGLGVWASLVLRRRREMALLGTG